jgi:hypothetical protein
LGGNLTTRGEAKYQRDLIIKIRQMIPGCFVLKNNPEETQGIPDLLILYGPFWAMLEVKASPTSHIQPNQEHYIEFFDEMSFCAFINPAIEEQVLDDLQHSFGIRR